MSAKIPRTRWIAKHDSNLEILRNALVNKHVYNPKPKSIEHEICTNARYIDIEFFIAIATIKWAFYMRKKFKFVEWLASLVDSVSPFDCKVHGRGGSTNL